MIPKGYKQTEVGVIPENWICVPLLDKCELLNGLTYTPQDICDYGICVLRSSNIQNNQLIFDDSVYVNCEVENRKFIQKNDIIICVRNGSSALIGKCAKADRNYNMTFGAFMAVLRGENNDYIFQVLQQGNIQKCISKNSGATINQITNSDFKSIFIALPRNKTELDYISKSLAEIDNFISKLAKLIEKKKAIKQGAMQELLTGKKRLPGFTGVWKKVTLGEIGNLTGSGVDKKIIPDEIPITLLNYTNVYHQVAISRKDLHHKVTASAEKIKNCSILAGDVLITPTSETPEDIALSAVATENMHDVVYSYHVIRLRPFSNYNGYFINYALSTPTFREQSIQFAEGSGIRYVITLKKFKDMNVFIPLDKDEQDAIATVLSDMDNEINALEQKLEKYRQIKQGMMEQLLSGKIRLVVTESAQVPEKLKSKGSGHNHQFDDAVTIAAIVNAFYSDRFPLGRKKVQKLLYLLRRKQESAVTEFKKKAAGPYADEIRYKGGEPIAKKNGYISVKSSKKGSVFSRGEKISDALEYVNKWELNDDINWLISNFRYTKTNILELLATIDMAICDLKTDGLSISLQNIKNLIRSNKEWKAKLDKTYFSDRDIIWAMNECKRLFE